jgi:lipopolysaccharide/colanic/teichoic acid biosynthesis glycosyltransferase
MKRLIDVLGSALGLLILSPLLAVILFLIWSNDRHSPFYIAPRVGRGSTTFRMVKLRSMRVNADKTGVDSTAANDSRITPVGHFVRRYKLDEVMQLWNVLKGDMSLVGPRPNVERETRMYTPVERRLLTVRPGITDLASIVFADEGQILEGRPDPDLAYNQLIRPWKSRLGLLYVDKANVLLDLRLIGLTVVAIASRPVALRRVGRLLQKLGADADLLRVAARGDALVPAPPPGSDQVVMARSQ